MVWRCPPQLFTQDLSRRLRGPFFLATIGPESSQNLHLFFDPKKLQDGQHPDLDMFGTILGSSCQGPKPAIDAQGHILRIMRSAIS